MEPTKKESKIGQFKQEWLLEFGLEISASSTPSRLVLTCMFCKKGREEGQNTIRKRKPTMRQKVYALKIWRKYNLRRHCLTQHSTCFEEYRALGKDAKKRYFQDDIQVNEGACCGEYAMSQANSEVTITVNKPIVDVVLCKLLNENNPEIEGGAPFKRWDPRVMFECNGEPGNDTQYTAVWENKLQFDLIVAHVASGVSFRQANDLITSTKEATGLGIIGCLNVEKVIQVVRLVCASNLQTISNVLNRAWAFSVAIDAGTKSSVPYLDVRARFSVARKMFNVHVGAIPMYERHTGANMANVIAQFFDAVAPNWKSQLISVSTDGASNMTGKYNGLVTYLDKMCLPYSKSRVYRIWCGAHQLDLVAQKIYLKLLDETFISSTQDLTSYLRCQFNLIVEMGTKCPTFVNTRWLSMIKLLSWMKSNRLKICAYMDENEAKCKPDLAWWAMVYALHDFAEILSIACRSMQGMNVTLEEQDHLLKNLSDRLYKAGFVQGPTAVTEPFGAGVYQNGCFYSCIDMAKKVVDNSDIFLRECITTLEANNQEAYLQVLSSITSMYVDAVHAISNISALRDSHNLPIDKLPPLVPRSIATMERSDFGNLLLVQYAS
jgi:hypothetical protein